MAARNWALELGHEPSELEEYWLKSGKKTVEQIKAERAAIEQSYAQEEEAPVEEPVQEEPDQSLLQMRDRPGMGEYYGASGDVALTTFKRGLPTVPGALEIGANEAALEASPEGAVRALDTVGKARGLLDSMMNPDPNKNKWGQAADVISNLPDMTDPFGYVEAGRQLGNWLGISEEDRALMEENRRVLQQNQDEYLAKISPELVEKERRLQEIKQARNPGFWEEAGADALASAPSFAPLLGGIIGQRVAGRAGRVLGAAGLAPLPAMQAAAQASLQGQRVGLRGAELADYIKEQTGSEFLFEAFAPGAGKSVLGTIARRLGAEQASEFGTSQAQNISDLTREETEKQAPRNFDEWWDQTKKVAGATLLGAGVIAPYGAKQATEERLAKEKKPILDTEPTLEDPNIEAQKTGDPAFDAALDIDKAMQGATFDTPIDLTKIWEQTFKTKPEEPNTFMPIPDTTTEVDTWQSADLELDRRAKERKAREEDIAYSRMGQNADVNSQMAEQLRGLQGQVPINTDPPRSRFDAVMPEQQEGVELEVGDIATQQPFETTTTKLGQAQTEDVQGPTPAASFRPFDPLQFQETNYDPIRSELPSGYGFQKPTKGDKKSRMDKKSAKPEVTAQSILEQLNSIPNREEANLDEDAIVEVTTELANLTIDQRNAMARRYESLGRSNSNIPATKVVEAAINDPAASPELRNHLGFLRRLASVKQAFVSFISNDGPEANRVRNKLGLNESTMVEQRGMALLKDTSWDRPSLHPVVIAHEVTHIATAASMVEAAAGRGNQKQLAAYQAVSDILQELRTKHLKPIAESLGMSEKAVSDSVFKNERELVAYASTDPQVQTYLRAQPSLWTKLLNALYDLLGMDTGNTQDKESALTMLDQIMLATYTIAAEQSDQVRAANYRAQQQRMNQASNMDEEITLSSDPDDMIEPETKATRRNFLTALGLALGIVGAPLLATRADKLTMGKAKGIPADILGAKVPREVENTLRQNKPGSLKAALERLAEVHPDPAVRAVAKSISKVVSADTTVVIDDTTKRNWHGEAGYDGKAPKVTLYTYGKLGGLDVGTVLHESSHAAVISRYSLLRLAVMEQNYSRMGTPRAAAQLKQLKDLFLEFKKIVSPSKIAAKYEEGESYSDEDISLYEASNDLDEFFVRALTDPLFQKYLQGIEYKGKTMLARFADWVKTTLFGFKEGTVPSWLDAALMASNELLVAMESDPADNAWASKSKPTSNASVAGKAKVTKPVTKKPQAKKVVPKPKFTQVSEQPESLEGIKLAFRSFFQSSKDLFRVVDPDILRFLEEAQQERVAMLYDNHSFWGAFKKATKGLSDDTVNRILEGDQQAVAGLSKQQRIAMNKVLNLRDQYTKTIIAETLAANPNMSNKNLAALNKAVQNLTNPMGYFHRMFIKDIKQKNIGKKHVKSLLDNRKSTDPKNKTAERWRKALDHIVQNELIIPSDLSKVPMHRLIRIFEHWTGRDASKINVPRRRLRKALTKELNSYRNATSAQTKLRADQILQELLGIINADSTQVTKYYGGSRLDKTIITPRKKIDQPILDLFGEIKDRRLALLATLGMQAAFIAQQRFLINMKSMGTGVFLFESNYLNAPEQVTEVLDNEAYGPLNGMKTTKEFRKVLEAYMEMKSDEDFYEMTSAMAKFKAFREAAHDKYVGAISAVKLIKLTTSAGRWALNGLSSTMTLMANGNFGAKGMASLIRNYGALASINFTKNSNPLVKKMIKYGVYDSAVFGQMTHEQIDEFVYEYQKSANPGKTHWQKFLNAYRVISKGVDTGLDTFKLMFALMDLLAKMSNFIYEVEAMKKIYPDSTLEEQESLAAERTKLTNYTWNRAGSIFKFLDKYGIQMFAVYLLSEVPRTLKNNFILGAADRAQGKKTGNKAQVAHGTKRLFGASAAVTSWTVAIPYLMQLAGHALLGDEDDEEKKRKAEAVLAAMNEGDRQKLIVPLGVDERGRFIGFDLSSLDPYDPMNALIRSVMSGDPDQVWEQAENLFFMNSLLGVATSRGLRPSTATTNEPLYQKQFNFLVSLDIPPDFANRMIYAQEQFMPTVVMGGMRKLMLGDDGPGVMEAIGFRPVIFDPRKAVFDASRYYTGVVTGKRAELAKKIINSGLNLDSNELRNFYVDAVEEELRVFNNMQDKIEGARAMDVSEESLALRLKQANVPNRDIPLILNGVFIPKTFSDEFLKQAQIEALLSSKSFEEKAKIAIALEASRKILKQIWYEDTVSRLQEGKANAN